MTKEVDSCFHNCAVNLKVCACTHTHSHNLAVKSGLPCTAWELCRNFSAHHNSDSSTHLYCSLFSFPEPHPPNLSSTVQKLCHKKLVAGISSKKKNCKALEELSRSVCICWGNGRRHFGSGPFRLIGSDVEGESWRRGRGRGKASWKTLQIRMGCRIWDSHVRILCLLSPDADHQDSIVHRAQACFTDARCKVALPVWPRRHELPRPKHCLNGSGTLF